MVVNDISRATQIIAKYAPNAEVWLIDDLLCCGEFLKTAAAMTQDERHLMDELGWFGDDDSNAWSRYI